MPFLGRTGPRSTLRAARSFPSPFRLVVRTSQNLCLVGAKDLGPEVVQISAKLVQAFAPHGVQSAATPRLDANQPRMLEHLQMLGDGGPAHRLSRRQFADRPR